MEARTIEHEPLRLHCIGVRFRTADPAVREALALTADEAADALERITIAVPGVEAVVLATCNRTELYVADAGNDAAIDAWHRSIGRRLPDSDCPASAADRYHLTGTAAVRHLFEVACGLDAAELGDTEIAGQVRRARDLGVDAGTVGPMLHKLFDTASRTSRVARSTTTISAGGAGIGSAVARCAEAHGLPHHPEVVVIGAGDAAAAVCRELDRRLHADLVVVNRTRSKARSLALQYGGAWDDLGGLPFRMATADAIVVAADAPEPLIDLRLVQLLREDDRSWAPLVIDTCVRPAVAPGLPLSVLSLDDLGQDEVDRVRLDAVPEVQRIVNDHVGEFRLWFRSRALDEMVAALYREADRVVADVRASSGDDTARLVRQNVRSLLHDHVTRLRALGADAGIAEALPAEHPEFEEGLR